MSGLGDCKAAVCIHVRKQFLAFQISLKLISIPYERFHESAESRFKQVDG